MRAGGRLLDQGLGFRIARLHARATCFDVISNCFKVCLRAGHLLTMHM